MGKACFLLPFLFLALCSPITVRALDQVDDALIARSLVAKSVWGVLSTISADLGGAPFGNVLSFSDGEPGHGFGIPYFYIAKLEPEGGALKNGTRAAFTISENPLGTCKIGNDLLDNQDPKCKSVILSGQLQLIRLVDPEIKHAQVALFTKHPHLKGFPAIQNYQIYKLVIEFVYLVKDFGNPKYLTPQVYLKGSPM